MRALVNQHSGVLFAALVLGGAWFLLRRRSRLLRLGVLLGLLAALAAGAAVLRTGTGDVRSPEDVSAALASGRPVVLDFYSNY